MKKNLDPQARQPDPSSDRTRIGEGRIARPESPRRSGDERGTRPERTADDFRRTPQQRVDEFRRATRADHPSGNRRSLSPFDEQPWATGSRPLRVERGGSSTRAWPIIVILALLLALLVVGYLLIKPMIEQSLNATTATTAPSTVRTTVPTTTAESAIVPTTLSTTTAVSDATPTTTADSLTTTEPTASVAEPSTTAPVKLTAEERRVRLAAMGKSVEQLISRQPKSRIAVYFQNLVSGETWQVNADKPFVAASSIKLGMQTYLYTKIADGSIKPDEMLAYDNRGYPTGDYEGGTGIVKDQPNGTRYSVTDTSSLAIRKSDNCANNMILRRLGGVDQVNPWLSSISAKVDYRKPISYTDYAGKSYTNGRHRTSAEDLAKHAAELYRLWKAEPDIYGPLLDNLGNTEFNYGVFKGMPADLKVVHKIGSNGTYRTENDLAIVFTYEPFVLAVMTEMDDMGTARQFESELGRIVYEYAKDLA